MDELLPHRVPALDDAFEHLDVERDDHTLVVTIRDREFSVELDRVIDAFEADPRSGSRS